MSSCEPIIVDGKRVCVNCKRELPEGRFASNCGKPRVDVRKATKPPGLVRKAINFASAWTQHKRNGSPKATPEEVEVRLAICAGCELFACGACAHSSCGCPMQRTKNFTSKVEWADQDCPLEKWPATAWQQAAKEPS